jgi:hypothetical protein
MRKKTRSAIKLIGVVALLPCCKRREDESWDANPARASHPLTPLCRTPTSGRYRYRTQGSVHEDEELPSLRYSEEITSTCLLKQFTASRYNDLVYTPIPYLHRRPSHFICPQTHFEDTTAALNRVLYQNHLPSLTPHCPETTDDTPQSHRCSPRSE